MQTLILGSSSPFRAEVLKKLGIDFIQHSPDIDESVLEEETAPSLVERLAKEKALAIAIDYPEALIIGSDQVAVIDGKILGKPGNHETAVKQLLSASGKAVTFYTGLALYNAQSLTMHHLIEPFTVHFRSLSEKQIHFYLEQEKPYQCAGSFKSEGLGIALFTKLDGDDPNSLIGLPLIKLIELLNKEGVDVLQLNE
jgi:septum formation protein